MAVNSFKFCCTNEDLSWLLNNLTLAAIVGDDLANHDRDGVSLILDLLFEHRGVGHEVGLELDFLPKSKELTVDLVVINYREPSYERAGLYTYEEFARGLYAELMRQSESDPVRRENANKLVQKYELQNYAST